MKTEERTLDLDKQGARVGQIKPIILRRGEHGLTQIVGHLTKDGLPFDATGYTAGFEAYTGDGKYVVGTAEVSTSSVTYNVASDFTSAPGDARLAYFTLEKSGDRITSDTIPVVILDCVDLTDEEAEEYQSSIDRLLSELEAYKAKIDEAIAEATSLGDPVETAHGGTGFSAANFAELVGHIFSALSASHSQSATADLDTILDQGIYLWNTQSLHNPGGSSSGVCLMISSDHKTLGSSWTAQLAFTTTGSVYHRFKNGSAAWSEWSQIYTSTSKIPTTSITGVLPIAQGGTGVAAGGYDDIEEKLFNAGSSVNVAGHDMHSVKDLDDATTGGVWSWVKTTAHAPSTDANGVCLMMTTYKNAGQGESAYQVAIDYLGRVFYRWHKGEAYVWEAWSDWTQILRTSDKIPLGSGVSGILPTANGGTGNANGTIAKLTNPRAFLTDLASEKAVDFDGSAANTHGVTGVLTIAHGGTGVTSLEELRESLAVYPVLEYNGEEYTNSSISAFLDAHRDGQAWGVSLPSGSAVACTKLGANAVMARPTPGIIGTPAKDPYVGHGPFFTMEVNAHIDADGVPHVTAIDGDGRFSRTGSEDVWILAPRLWWRFDEKDTATEIWISDSPLPGYEPQPKMLLPDGSMRPYMLYAKYPLSIVDGKPRSVSGVKIANRTVSHNSMITTCKTATSGYSAKSIADDWYVKVMFLMKYATKNSQSVFGGCTSYNLQYAPAIAEKGVKRVVLTDAQAANVLVGSAFMLGTNSPASVDRASAKLFDIFDGEKVTRKESVGSGQTAIYFEGLASTIDTETTYLLSTAPWGCGACDSVEGDGSPINNTSNREPFTIQGIEMGHGLYEVMGDVIAKGDGTSWRAYTLADTKLSTASPGNDYTDTGKTFPGGNVDTDAWQYPLTVADADGFIMGKYTGAAATTGMCDGTYTNKSSTTGLREVRCLGSLSGGALAGVFCVSCGSALSDARWDIGSRLSGNGRSRG